MEKLGSIDKHFTADFGSFKQLLITGNASNRTDYFTLQEYPEKDQVLSEWLYPLEKMLDDNSSRHG